ncbi:hypothetical protein [Roseimarinus sediminis]|uniref:hypothetical protein n=1 Tax=Roseimarinus sediminis TaxID=1610899 RepID=UPI003D231EC3
MKAIEDKGKKSLVVVSVRRKGKQWKSASWRTRCWLLVACWCADSGMPTCFATESNGKQWKATESDGKQLKAIENYSPPAG